MTEELNSLEDGGLKKRKKIIIFGVVILLLCCCVTFFVSAWIFGDSVVGVLCEQLDVLCQ